jgi:hypothetical protein
VKDANRRKRVNRFAKLKQCKLDARREQWLSHGSQGKRNAEQSDQRKESLDGIIPGGHSREFVSLWMCGTRCHCRELLLRTRESAGGCVLNRSRCSKGARLGIVISWFSNILEYSVA